MEDRYKNKNWERTFFCYRINIFLLVIFLWAWFEYVLVILTQKKKRNYNFETNYYIYTYRYRMCVIQDIDSSAKCLYVLIFIAFKQLYTFFHFFFHWETCHVLYISVYGGCKERFVCHITHLCMSVMYMHIFYYMLIYWYVVKI